MENHGFLPTMVIRANINCCPACPKRLKKLLTNIRGVCKVIVEPEKELVSVVGKADPKKVMQAISNMGKQADLLSHEKDPHSNECSQTAHETMDRKSCSKKANIRKNGRSKVCCCDGEHDDRNAHKVEAYLPPQVDGHICGDPFCRVHKRWPLMHPPYYSVMDSFTYIGDAHGGGCTIM